MVRLLCMILLLLAESNSAYSTEIRQYFLADGNGQAQSGWRINYQILQRGNGYGNSEVWHFESIDFMRGHLSDGQEDWVRVLNNLALAEIYVPYNDGTYVLDITPQTSWGAHLPPFLSYRFVRAKQSYLPKAAIEAKVMPDEVVISELVDDGIRYMDGRRDDGVRRGQTLWLWATLSAGNYRYVIRYGFVDDGTISVRVGGTAENLRDDEDTPTNRPVHLHMGAWRMEFALGSPEHNSVRIVERIANLENDTAKVIYRPFNAGLEGGEVWVAEKFTSLKVMNHGVTNLHNPPRNIGYKLVPLRSGSARSGQPYTKFDLWVTRRDPEAPARRRRLPELKFVDVPENVAEPEPLDGHATVVWYSSALSHIPRTEDFGAVGYRRRDGVAILMSTGFDLMPHDLWHKTPFLERD